MKPALVDMGTLELVEKRIEKDAGLEKVTKEELTQIPTGGDPLQALTSTSGVFSGAELLDYYLDEWEDRYLAAGDLFSNDFSVYHLWIGSNDTGINLAYDIFQEQFAETDKWESLCQVREIACLEKASLVLNSGTGFEWGGNYNFYELGAEYQYWESEREYVEQITGIFPQYDPKGPQLLMSNSFVDKEYAAGVFFSMNQNIGSFVLEAGSRYDYFQFFDDDYLSLRGRMSYQGENGFNAAISGGSYPDKLDYLSITRGVYESEYTQYTPQKISYAYIANADLGYQISSQIDFNAAVYYNRLYDLSAANFLLDDKMASEGKTWGMEGDLEFRKSESELWDFHYTWSRSRYYVPDEGWLSPDSEIYHQLIVRNYTDFYGPFSLGATLRLNSGRRFTPFIVTGINGDSFDVAAGEYNSEIDYLPWFILDLSLKWKRAFSWGDWEIFLDITDFLRGSVDYYDPDFVGQDTRNWYHRQYYINVYDREYIKMPALDFGIKVSL